MKEEVRTITGHRTTARKTNGSVVVNRTHGFKAEKITNGINTFIIERRNEHISEVKTM
jgi:hypothetical protein